MDTISHALTCLLPSGTWLIGLFVILVVAALPRLIGIALASKGQSASGWLIVIGAIGSAFALRWLLTAYFAATAIYLTYRLLIG